MNDTIKSLSMTCKMAYVILCAETWLRNTHPDRDWTIVSEAMWKATEMDWGDWPEMYAGFLPNVLYSYDGYDDDLAVSFPGRIYRELLGLYDGLTDGAEDDPLNVILSKPFEMAMVYEGTGIGDGHEADEIIMETERCLVNRGIPLPDAGKLLSSDCFQSGGWGTPFDGRFLSGILKPQVFDE